MRKLPCLISLVLLLLNLNGCSHPPHVDGHVVKEDLFQNDPPSANKSLWELLRWQSQRHPPTWHYRATVEKPTLATRVYQGVHITPINHASVLIQMAGLNVLTDPIWSNRASPVTWAGPERFHPPALALVDLPPIDVVLVSHNHYDHCDLPTLQALQQRFAPLFVTPLGNAALIAQATGGRVVSLDWWQTHVLAGLTLHLTPARHWSSRFIVDRNQALWGGFMLSSAHTRVFFAGDTSWGTHFAAIKARLGAPTVALLPIGAYLPRDFMQDQHIDPAQAVQAYQTLGAQFGLGIHHGTFQLADEGQDQATQDLAHAREQQQLLVTQFPAATPGHVYRYP